MRMHVSGKPVCSRVVRKQSSSTGGKEGCSVQLLPGKE